MIRYRGMNSEHLEKWEAKPFDDETEEPGRVVENVRSRNSTWTQGVNCHAARYDERSHVTGGKDLAKFGFVVPGGLTND